MNTLVEGLAIWDVKQTLMEDWLAVGDLFKECCCSPLKTVKIPCMHKNLINNGVMATNQWCTQNTQIRNASSFCKESRTDSQQPNQIRAMTSQQRSCPSEISACSICFACVCVRVLNGNAYIVCSLFSLASVFCKKLSRCTGSTLRLHETPGIFMDFTAEPHYIMLHTPAGDAFKQASFLLVRILPEGILISSCVSHL